MFFPIYSTFFQPLPTPSPSTESDALLVHYLLFLCGIQRKLSTAEQSPVGRFLPLSHPADASVSFHQRVTLITYEP